LKFKKKTNRFIEDFGVIAVPLKRLLKKEGFLWTLETEETFHGLQQALTTTLTRKRGLYIC
jgi:hypothetical protein